MPNPVCFMDVEIGGEPAGRLVFELFAGHCPKTAENFRSLCVGTRAADGRWLHYKGHIFHRIIEWFIIQGGDITHDTGEGGESIYGRTFADENLALPHAGPGVLSMANAGPDTNNSQFLLATGPRYNLKHLDGMHVVFGGLVQGWNTLRRLEATPTGPRDRPVAEAVIADCGELMDWVADEAGEGPYMDHPEDQGTPELLARLGAEAFYLGPREPTGQAAVLHRGDLAAVMKVGEDLKQLGNDCFRTQQYQEALQRYEQAMRYLQWYNGPPDSGVQKEVMVQCYNNVAACQLKLGRGDLALSACDRLLELDSRNAKGYFRRATAYKHTNDPDKCLRDVRRALQLQPQDAACKKLEKEMQELIAQQQQQHEPESEHEPDSSPSPLGPATLGG